jgi:two-component system cell cycle sensor histidine kinase PleC
MSLDDPIGQPRSKPLEGRGLVLPYALIIAGGLAGLLSLQCFAQQHGVLATAALTVVALFALLCAELGIRSRKLTQQSDELQEVSNALRNSKARFRDFALTASDWFWETNSEHRFTYTSDSIRAFGQDPDARIGRTRMELAADVEAEQEKWLDHVATLDHHKPFRDFVYTRKLGAEPEHILSVSGRPVFDGGGQFLGYRGTARDVTEQVRAQRRLEEARRAAEAANVAKAQFIANMSHELRTPLNAIIGFAGMIGAAIKGPLPSEYQEYGRLIEQSGKHLLGIIGDVLDLSKIDAGKFKANEEEIDPNRLVHDVIDLMRDQAEKNSVHLSTTTSRTGLPLVLGDPRLLRQVLLNLLSNAIKFTEPGGRVLLFAGVQAGDMVFEVTDTGIGMTACELDTAMELFGQAEAGFARPHQGTGLGLPLARSFVELHGGSLQLESEKGRGTTARMILPASRVCSATAQPV